MAQPENNKCTDCGAIVSPEDKACKYCSTPNPNWQNPAQNNSTKTTHTFTKTESSTTTTTTTSTGPVKLPETDVNADTDPADDDDLEMSPSDEKFIQEVLAPKPQTHYFTTVVVTITVIICSISAYYETVVAPRKAAAAKLAEQSWQYANKADEKTAVTVFTASLRTPQGIDYKYADPILAKTVPSTTVQAFLHLLFNGKTTVFIELKDEKNFAKEYPLDSSFVSVKFDDTEPENFEVTAFQNALNLQDHGDDFISHLKASKKTSIKVWFKNNPWRKMEFVTDNLVWNH